jgi:hypothetical protein
VRGKAGWWASRTSRTPLLSLSPGLACGPAGRRAARAAASAGPLIHGSTGWGWSPWGVPNGIAPMRTKKEYAIEAGNRKELSHGQTTPGTHAPC